MFLRDYLLLDTEFLCELDMPRKGSLVRFSVHLESLKNSGLLMQEMSQL